VYLTNGLSFLILVFFPALLCDGERRISLPLRLRAEIPATSFPPPGSPLTTSGRRLDLISLSCCVFEVVYEESCSSPMNPDQRVFFPLYPCRWRRRSLRHNHSWSFAIDYAVSKMLLPTGCPGLPPFFLTSTVSFPPLYFVTLDPRGCPGCGICQVVLLSRSLGPSLFPHYMGSQHGIPYFFFVVAA